VNADQRTSPVISDAHTVAGAQPPPALGNPVDDDANVRHATVPPAGGAGAARETRTVRVPAAASDGFCPVRWPHLRSARVGPC